ncbi:MAG: DNA-3-methyladenine glycosylase I [Alphaproteobacteria bacterium]|jgi:DNA-3-methyladenine glycosylase I|nr:DNA-3-methyladenine glycosylase I [Alphaproteobacteria bacterium]
MNLEQSRCSWCGEDPLYVAYHDTEWGVPEWDDRALFEKLMLDGFQAGLSWITILRKRDNFRRAFDGFAPEVVARYDATKCQALMADAGIVRNRQKIEATIGNAQAWLKIMEEDGSFADFLWRFTDGRPLINRRTRSDQIPAETAESRAMSKALKAAGFRFCGPTICYAVMQACGIVNDHVVDCFRHGEV